MSPTVGLGPHRWAHRGSTVRPALTVWYCSSRTTTQPEGIETMTTTTTHNATGQGCPWHVPGCSPAYLCDNCCEALIAEVQFADDQAATALAQLEAERTPPQLEDAPELNKADSFLIHGHEFLLLPLVAVVLGLVLVLSAAPAQASKWQGWDSWCLTHHRHHQAMCR